MANLQEAFAEAVKLNRQITQFLKFSTYTDYDDLSGLDGIDRTDGEQLLLWEELRIITDKLADAQERIAYLTRPIVEGLLCEVSDGAGHFLQLRQQH